MGSTEGARPQGPALPDERPAQARLPLLDEGWHRVLAVVAHPDDLEFGAASAVARWTSQGKQVSYLLATRGEAGIDGIEPERAGVLREAEERASARVVGVGEVDFLDHEDGVVEYGPRLRRDIASAIRRTRPDLVLSLSHRLEMGGWINMADHRAVGLAVIDAVRDAGNRWVFRDLAEQGIEPWNGVRMTAFFASPAPTHAVDVTGHIDRGVESLRCHAAYIAGLGNDFDPEAFLRESAAGSGRRAGCEYAVLLEVLGS
ncbi:MAG TPA: PIG-L deacetylase family protein [Acidimicrobiales bacterium]|nr:PIG-L deacetylase family protein [Acidimicrobiales bacterium]